MLITRCQSIIYKNKRGGQCKRMERIGGCHTSLHWYSLDYIFKGLGKRSISRNHILYFSKCKKIITNGPKMGQKNILLNYKRFCLNIFGKIPSYKNWLQQLNPNNLYVASNNVLGTHGRWDWFLGPLVLQSFRLYLSEGKVIFRYLKLQNLNLCRYKYIDLIHLFSSLSYNSYNRPRTIDLTFEKGRFWLKAMRSKPFHS